MSYSAVGDLFYNIFDKNDVPVGGGGVTQVGGKTINTLEEYNQSVLGPMQVPAGGRVITFSTEAAQTAYMNDVRSRLQSKGSGATKGIEAFFRGGSSYSQPTTVGMPLRTKLLIGAGALAALWLMVKR
jgi:hypothetical protein